MIIAVFQAVGKGTEPLILSILHKGSVDIVLMFLIWKTIGVSQITWASPVSEALALIVGIIMIIRFSKEANPLLLQGQSHFASQNKEDKAYG